MKHKKALLVLLLLAAAWVLAACGLRAAMHGNGAGASAGERDISTTRLSDRGLYRVSYESELDAEAINVIHNWTLTVETAGGEPVENAAIRLEGGMPDHGHGLPTAPKVTEDLGDGRYRVEGIKYSMPGWWTLTFEIDANGEADLVTFNIVLD